MYRYADLWEERYRVGMLPAIGHAQFLYECDSTLQPWLIHVLSLIFYSLPVR